MVERISIKPPKVFKECSKCEFVSRAALQAQKIFPNVKSVKFECELSGGGGSKQIKLGEWVDFKSRILKVTPSEPGLDLKSECLVSQIPVCPIDIKDSPNQHPNIPAFERVVTDIFDRTFRNKVRQR